MNMRSAAVLVIFSLVILNLTAFTVNERELAIKLQVGDCLLYTSPSPRDS